MTPVEVPIPPSTNALWRAVRNRGPGAKVKVVKSAAYRAWTDAAVMLLRLGLPVARSPVAVRVVITGGKGWAAKRDIDNAVKAVLDAVKLAGRVPDDDCERVTDVYAVYLPPKANGAAARCEVSFLPAGHLARLEALVEALAERVAAQSELLSKRAEAKA